MYRFAALVSVALLCAPTLACAQKAAPAAKYDLSAASNQKFLNDNAAKPGVYIGPGSSELARMPSGPYVTAVWRVSEITAPLAAW